MTTSAQKIMLKCTLAEGKQFLRNCGAQRYAFNWALKRWRHLKSDGVLEVRTNDLRKEFNSLKTPWMYESPKGCFDQGIKNFATAKSNHYKNSKHFQFPKHKSKYGRKSFYIENDKAHIVDSTHIKLPLIKRHIELAEPIKPKCLHGHINSFVVSLGKNGAWYVSISYQYDDSRFTNKVETDGIEGIDLGIKTLMTLASGISVPNNHYLNQKAKRLQRYQRQMSRRYRKGHKSRNYKMAIRKFRKLSRSVSNARLDYIHKQTTSIVRRNMLVVTEDLHSKGMLHNKHLARAISDASFGKILEILKYKCNNYGSTLIQVGRFFPSSKKCSRCGNVKETLSLSEREYVCEHCSLVMDRDRNAAVNILAEGLFLLIEQRMSTDVARREFTPAEIVALARRLLFSSETKVVDAASKLPLDRQMRMSGFLDLLVKNVVDKTTI